MYFRWRFRRLVRVIVVRMTNHVHFVDFLVLGCNWLNNFLQHIRLDPHHDSIKCHRQVLFNRLLAALFSEIFKMSNIIWDRSVYWYADDWINFLAIAYPCNGNMFCSKKQNVSVMKFSNTFNTSHIMTISDIKRWQNSIYCNIHP